jgi:outer membrane cobalamin receptor
MQVHYIGDRYAYTQYPSDDVSELTQNWAGVPGQAVKLRGFVDANLQVRYQYNPQIAGWANVYNTVAQRYQMWNGYNQQRVLFMMGAAVSF